MPRLELPLGIKGSTKLPRTLQTLRNCFNADGLIFGRRGVTLRSSTGGEARGSFVWNGSLYGVVGTDLIKITDLDTGSFSTIGTIAGSESIQWAIGFNTAVLLNPSSAGKIYSLDKSDTLVDIAVNQNFVACRDVTHMNGRFIYIPFDGDPAFFSDVGAAGTVGAASFFDAEELPDLNKAVANLRNTLYIFGTDSVELFRDVGTVGLNVNPFKRISGARIDRGFIGGLIEYSDSLAFVGREKDQSAGIYGIENGAGVKLSNERIDEILEGYDPSVLADAIPGRLKMRGYDILTYKFTDDSFGYRKGEWFILESVVADVSVAWLGGYIAQIENNYYSFSGENFGIFTDINTDYGNPITRIIDMSLNDPEGRRFTCSRIEIGISQGFDSGIRSVGLFMTRDNVTYPIGIFRDLGLLGEYTKRLRWQPPGGLGNYIGFMGVRIYTTQDVVFEVDSFIADLQQ